MGPSPLKIALCQEHILERHDLDLPKSYLLETSWLLSPTSPPFLFLFTSRDWLCLSHHLMMTFGSLTKLKVLRFPATHVDVPMTLILVFHNAGHDHYCLSQWWYYNSNQSLYWSQRTSGECVLLHARRTKHITHLVEWHRVQPQSLPQIMTLQQENSSSSSLSFSPTNSLRCEDSAMGGLYPGIINTEKS